MATVKVLDINNHLARVVNYASNLNKTDIRNIVEYAGNPSKTEQKVFVGSINCVSCDTAIDEMNATKIRWCKTDGILVYHFIQSFVPGEATPQQAHDIGMKFAQECFGSDYETVIGTHLDKDHLHNHIVINSVAFTNGKKYQINRKKLLYEIRPISDRICKEFGLSVLDPSRERKKTKSYSEWLAEHNEKGTIRSMVRRDIDEMITRAFNFDTLLDNLRDRGYEVKNIPSRKYVTIRPPGGERYIRIDSLGETYTKEKIEARILKQALMPGENSVPPSEKKRYKFKGNLSARKKICGFRALYYRYVYMLRKIEKHKISPRQARPYYSEVTRLKKYNEQYLFLCKWKIDTHSDLNMYRDAVQAKIDFITDHRAECYKIKRTSCENHVLISAEAAAAKDTLKLRELRSDFKACDKIKTDSTHISEKLKNTWQTNNNINYERDQNHVSKRRRN